MKIQIRSRFSDAVVFETDANSLMDAIIAALKARADLSDASLRGANLSDADLRGASLRGADLSDASLRGANLSDADLRGANLSDADLRGANLSDADLFGAHLSDASLSDASLRGANLSDADLRGANLSDADLSGAHLRRAVLRGADLSDASLSDASLRGADLSDADLLKLVSQRSILPEGELIVFKKLQNDKICKLRIPENAKRVGGVIGRKCRAEFAYVVSGEGISRHDSALHYKEGELVKPDKFDPNPLVECSHGIHFFITEQEAKNY